MGVRAATFTLEWRSRRQAGAGVHARLLPAAYDVYIEITTLNQKLVTKKNRKARRLRELHPDVQIRVLYQRDYLHLLVKYGLEPPSQLADADEGRDESRCCVSTVAGAPESPASDATARLPRW